MLRIALVALSIALAGCASVAPPAAGPTDDAPAQEAGRAFGDARVIAKAPGNWFIEGVALLDGRVYAGTAFGALGDPIPYNNLGQPSRIFGWNPTTGELETTLLVEGEDTMRPHGTTGIASDAEGRLYVLSSQVGLVRWNVSMHEPKMERVATFPDLKPCTPVTTAPCSPTLRDEPAIPNDLTWGPDGALYVSDSFQATVWRVSPEGEVSIWFQHADLDRKFGPNGLRVTPDGARVVLAVTGPDSLDVGPLSRASKVFSIPFPDPQAGPMEVLHTLPNGDYADGIAFGERGDLYVLANSGNRLYVYPAAGGAPQVVGNEDIRGAAMDFPASIAFDGSGAIVVCNYAYSDGNANPDGRSVIEIFVDDRGLHRTPPTGIQIE